MNNQHTRFMQRALSLALKGKGWVHPNPLVGCVLVKNGRIVGEGFHSRYGGAHAEINALKQAGSASKGAALYINLEPCAHWGKTPPCSPALIKAGIKAVYIAHKDPNPSVNGKGIQTLKKAGIRVYLGCERQASEQINRPFLTWMKQGRPYTILKLAMSLDGKIATRTGDSKWISSPESRTYVHKLRSESDAVLIGANTALRDNPVLTSHGRGRDPIRVIVDPWLQVKPTARVFNQRSAATWVITSDKSPSQKAKALSKKGAIILRESLKFGQINTINIVKYLSKNAVSQLFIEGGGETAWTFISKNLVDEILIFIAPMILGGRDAKTPVEGLGVGSIGQAFELKGMSAVRLGTDLLIRGLLRRSLLR